MVHISHFPILSAYPSIVFAYVTYRLSSPVTGVARAVFNVNFPFVLSTVKSVFSTRVSKAPVLLRAFILTASESISAAPS